MGFVSHHDVFRGGVVVGVEGDCAQAHHTRATQDSDRYFAAVRDQDFFHRYEICTRRALRLFVTTRREDSSKA
jgi:hypothetical protein